MFKRIVIHVIHQLRPKTPPGLHHSQFVQCGANSRLQSPAPVASVEPPALVGGQQPAPPPLSPPLPVNAANASGDPNNVASSSSSVSSSAASSSSPSDPDNDPSSSSSSSSSSSTAAPIRLPVCITRFVSTLLGLLNSSGRKWTKNLSEYFALLLDFASLGVEEKRFLNSLDTVAGLAAFYLGQKSEGAAKGTGASSVQVRVGHILGERGFTWIKT